MIQYAIVEDEDFEADNLIGCLKRFGEEMNESVQIDRFTDAYSYLESKKTYDVVFMDIMLPNMNGMDAAAHMRKTDSKTTLIFVTNMTQFAIKGYEVDAFDFVIKPVTYERIEGRLKKLLERTRASHDSIVTIRSEGGLVRFLVNQIYYIEVSGHKLSYITNQGVFTENGSMKVVEEKFKEFNFMRCNSCYLVNPEQILFVKGFSIQMRNNDELKISQPKRKAFMNEFTAYLSQKES